MFMYLPLFLTNAMGNKGLGLRAGLQGLVELYNKLLKHQCLKEDVSTVKVDMSLGPSEEVLLLFLRSFAWKWNMAP